MSIKNIVIGIAIIVLTILVSFYGINTFYPKPNYDDFCGDINTQEVIETQERCEELGGKWSVYEAVEPIKSDVKGFCDRGYYCRQELGDATRLRSRNVFFIALPLAILIIIVGAFLFKLEFVGAGLMGGGVGTLIYGAGAYWPYSENWIKFILSLIGLLILIGFSYWFSKKKFGKKKK